MKTTCFILCASVHKQPTKNQTRKYIRTQLKEVKIRGIVKSKLQSVINNIFQFRHVCMYVHKQQLINIIFCSQNSSFSYSFNRLILQIFSCIEFWMRKIINFVYSLFVCLFTFAIVAKLYPTNRIRAANAIVVSNNQFQAHTLNNTGTVRQSPVNQTHGHQEL